MYSCLLQLCEESLVDLVYFRFKDNRLLCGRHWNDMHRPRCHGCDETIFNDEFTVAEGKNWHPAHFACFTCDRALDDEYVMVDGQPICLRCHDVRVNSKCAACSKLIETKSGKVSDGKDGGKVRGGGGGGDGYNFFPILTHALQNWHSTCYKCGRCGVLLEGQACFPVGKELLCAAGLIGFIFGF
jgi:hypothetical protein